MKRLVLFCFLLCGFFECFAATYYSQGSLPPNNLASWNTVPGGGGAAPGTFTNPGDRFIIQSTHTMITNAIWTVGGTGSTLQIQSSGALQGNHTIMLTGTFQIDDAGTYIHNNTSSVAQGAGMSIFSGTEAFSSNSNFEIRLWINPLVGLPNNSIVWGNLIINLQIDFGAAWNFNIADGQTLTISGNFDVQSTGFPNANDLRLTGTGTQTINVGGNVLISGVNSYVAVKKNSSPSFDGITTMQVNGNINVSGTCTLEITGSSATIGSGTQLRFKSHLNNAGTITTNGSVSAVNQFELNGTSNQNISSTGTLSGNQLSFIMTNAAGATLLSPLTLPRFLSLNIGIIKTTLTNILTIVDDGASSNGGPASFINGPMKKIGDDAFIFPVGEGNEYAPIEISVGGTTTDAFIATYFRGNPKTLIDPDFENPPIDHMSRLEWWTLDQAVGTSTKNVTLYARTYSDATQLSDLRILKWDGTWWANAGYTTSSGVAVGPVTSQPVTGFFPAGTPTPFTFGSVTPYPANPLPIDLITFDATKLTSAKSLITWELAACCSSAAKFEVQRAGANKNFISIGSVGGSETNRYYTYNDNGLQSGINYYRLKMTDVDGTIAYSKTMAIMNGIKGLYLTSLIPTTINKAATLTIASSASYKMDLMVVDMSGRLVMKQNYSVGEGNATIQLSLEKLAAGVYQLIGVSSEGKTNIIRFIK